MAVLAVVALLCAVAAASFSGAVSAKAEGVSDWEDGSYAVSYSVGGTSMPSMVTSRFDSTVIVDKVGENYYMSLSQTDGISSMQNLTLSLSSNTDGKVIGQEITENTDSRKTYRYTLSAEDIASSLNYSVYITAMGSTQSFTVTLDLDSAVYVGEVDLSADRPAQYVPAIVTAAGDEYEVTVGSSFAVPSATATIGSQSCDVTYSVYYIGESGNEAIDADSGSFTLEKQGEYHLVYRATSSLYKTMLGNDTYSEYDVKIISSSEATSVAYFEDINGALPYGTTLQASKVTSGTVYNTAADNMAKLSDNFEVYSILFYNNGEEADLQDEVNIYISTSLNTSKTVVYYMDSEGNITKLSSSASDGYVKVTTDKTGTFIVCIPGVAMSKMTKMIILAAVLLAVIIIVAVTVPVVVHKKRKKKRLQK